MSKDANYKRLWSLGVVMLATIAGLITSYYYFSTSKSTTSELHIQEKHNLTPQFNNLLVYPEAKSFSGFELINHKGQKITIEDFADQWTLVFFGFTSCPDVCPTTLAELKKTYKMLKQRNITNPPEVLFVSVDPERDNTQQLKDYINFFNPSFTAATGNDANLLSLTSQMGVAFHVDKHQPDESNYNVDHTAAIFVVNPEKQLYGLFRTPHHSDKILEDIITLTKN